MGGGDGDCLAPPSVNLHSSTVVLCFACTRRTRAGGERLGTVPGVAAYSASGVRGVRGSSRVDAPLPGARADGRLARGCAREARRVHRAPAHTRAAGRGRAPGRWRRRGTQRRADRRSRLPGSYYVVAARTC